MSTLYIIILSILLVAWTVILIAVIAVTLDGFWYETFHLRVFYEQIKHCIVDEQYNIPFPFTQFNKLNIFGKIVFGLVWIFFLPSYVIGIICSFIIWIGYWIIRKTCFKKNMED